MARKTRTINKTGRTSNKNSFSLEIGAKIKEVKLEKKLATKDKTNFHVIKAKFIGDKVVSSDKNAREPSRQKQIRRNYGKKNFLSID